MTEEDKKAVQEGAAKLALRFLQAASELENSLEMIEEPNRLTFAVFVASAMVFSGYAKASGLDAEELFQAVLQDIENGHFRHRLSPEVDAGFIELMGTNVTIN